MSKKQYELAPYFTHRVSTKLNMSARMRNARETVVYSLKYCQLLNDYVDIDCNLGGSA